MRKYLPISLSASVVLLIAVMLPITHSIAGPPSPPSTSQIRSIDVATATPIKSYRLSAASDGVRPTDTPTPTPIPTPAPTPTVPIPYRAPAPQVRAAAYTPPNGELSAIICSVPWPCDQALSVANCESTMNPNAVSSTGIHNGLFQVAHGSFDPATNVQQAYTKYLDGVSMGNPWWHWNQFGGCGHF